MGKFIIMCNGGFPTFCENQIILADLPNELKETDLFETVADAKKRVLEMRKDKHYKYEDFEIMKILNYEDLMNEDLTNLEYVETVFGGA